MAGMDNFSQEVQGQAQSQAQSQVPEQQLPLAMRALAASPVQAGAVTYAGFNTNRFANTMFKGGFLDTDPGASGKRAAVKNFLGKRTGAYAGNTMQDNKAFAFGRSILGDDRSVFGKNIFGTGQKVKAAATNSVLNPAAFGRFDSVARLAGDTSQKGIYTPFQTTSFVTEKLFSGKGRLGTALKGRFADDFNAAGQLGEGKTLYSGGVFGRINTMGRIMDYEKQVASAAGLPSGGLTRGEARIARRGEKAAARLAKLDQNIVKLGIQTDAQFINTAVNNASSGMSSSRAAGFKSTLLKDADFIADTQASLARTGRLSAVSQTSRGVVSKRIGDYFGTMMGGGAQFEGTKAFTNTANTFAKAMEGSRFGGLGAGALDDAAHATKSAMTIATRTSGYTDDAMNLLKMGDRGMIRQTAGKLGMQAFARREFGTAAKMAGHYAGTYGKIAGKALGIVGTAAMVYDIGKGVGKMMMGGVNFGKDALKSMQGSINKPLFGAGFKDNEVAATSRSRGVMAIQNSRLNARSSLGSEGAMMAAHFG